MRSATHRQRWGTRGPTLSWVSRCAPAACGEGVTLRSGSPCPCPCCSRCCSGCTRTTPHTRARAPLLNTHTRATTRAARGARARARQVRVCIEALKPSLQNGGRGFKASMQKVAFTICPYYMLHYEFVRSRDGIQGYGYGTVPVWYGTVRTGTGTSTVPYRTHVNVNCTSAPQLRM